jgi:hypothetical protein
VLVVDLGGDIDVALPRVPHRVLAVRGGEHIVLHRVGETLGRSPPTWDALSVDELVALTGHAGRPSDGFPRDRAPDCQNSFTSGLREAGIVAAHEAGLVLSRVALVPEPGPDLVAITSALLDGLELVVVAGTQRLRAGDRQRLAARARQRNAVLMPFGGTWPGADIDVDLINHPGQWQGLSGDGHGRLRARRTQVRVTSRGAPHRGRKATVLLPGPNGALSTTERPGLSTVTSPYTTQPPPSAAEMAG